MSATLAPRVVVVSRRSELDDLLARHGTRAAAGYFLRQRGRDIDEAQQRHTALESALAMVGAAVPADWRRGNVDRDDLSRFLFAPEDIVITVGQDGLVANVAKYLAGQPVLGVNPEPDRNPGVLARFAPAELAKLLPAVPHSRRIQVEERAMVAALLDDGQRLAGLNEIYVGHTTHQSARYVLEAPRAGRERHSSSGVIVGTGTGATGWCSSIAHDRGFTDLPGPDSADLCWFVREAWASPATGSQLTGGNITAGEHLTLVSESERLVAFADGVEDDRLVLAWGQRLRIGVAEQRLRLVTG